MSIRRGSSCAVLVLTALLALAVPALGSSVSPANAKGGGAIPAARFGSTPQTSSSLAGYSPESSHWVARVSETTTIVVPKIKNCATKKQAVSAEVQLWFTDQGNSDFDQAGLLIECVRGKARYYPWTTTGRSSLQAHPGDKVVITEDITAHKHTASVQDMTHKSVKSTYTQAGSFKGGPYFIGLVGTTSVPDFGTIKFSASTVNGQPLAASSTRYDRYRNSTLLIKTTKLAAADESFKTIFEHH